MKNLKHSGTNSPKGGQGSPHRTAYQKAMPAGGIPHKHGSKGRSPYQSLASSPKGRAAHT